MENTKDLKFPVLNYEEFFQKWGTKIGPIMEDYIRKAPEFPEEMYFAELLGIFMQDFRSAYLEFKRDQFERGVTFDKFCREEISKANTRVM